MFIAESCPLCGNSDLRSLEAVVPPFVTGRYWGVEGYIGAKLMSCVPCQFFFFNPRPDEEEMQRYYRGYMDEAYKASRQRLEPTFTETIARNISQNPVELASRHAEMDRNLKPFLGGIKSVLDYGGGDGKMIPQELTGARRVICDVDDQQLMPGVEMVHSLTELSGQTFDLILLCHVLEHVCYPLETLRAVSQLAHQGTVYYIELPHDVPIQALSDFWGLGNRKPIVWAMSEHINWFTPFSVWTMLRRAGLRTQTVRLQLMEFGWIRAAIMTCVATRGE